MLIDTHVHTNYSDGLDDLAAVIDEAAATGVSILSITDHDCVRAYPEALKLAYKKNIRMVPGVELTTKNEQGCYCIHVVGLGIRSGSKASAVLDKVCQARDDSNRGFLENFNIFMALKYPKWEPVTDIKPSVFQNAWAVAGRLHLKITEKELMDVVLNQNLWVPIEYEITLDEAVSYIKQWGGVPVLAHPFDFSNDVKLVLERFLAAGGEGVELCKYRYKVRSEALSHLSPEQLVKKEREMNLWTVEQARRHRLKLTMASDHHDGHRAMGMDPQEYGIDVSWLYEL
jgi:predicted metal-dependent phosphoesterase TrpH